MSELYPKLAERFDRHYKLPKGGADLDYISTEQCITRLNDVLGVDGWEFEIREHGCENNTLWALGRLTAHFPTRTVAREQFGECATSRGMADGDARKGAGSDALKKCATLIGVALYLSDKAPATPPPAPARPARATPVTAPSGTGAASRAPAESARTGGATLPIQTVGDFWLAAQALFQCNASQTASLVRDRLGQEAGAYQHAHGLAWSNVYTVLEANLRDGEPIPGGPPSLAGLPPATEATEAPGAFGCAVCGKELEEIKFRDGTSWPPAKMAEISTRKHGKPLCMTHYREMNAAKRGTQRAAVEV